MAIKEPWRGNPAEKQYQFLTDFSGGMNTKIEDSLLKDNVARNITNFDIIAGGLLSKRKGVKPFMESAIKEYLKGYYNITSPNENDINRGIDKKVENSWTFYNGDRFVIVLKVHDGIINAIVGKDDNGKDVISFSNRKFISKNVVVEKYGNKQVLVYFDSSSSVTKPFILSWKDDNWVDYNSSDENQTSVYQEVKNINKEFDFTNLSNILKIKEYGYSNPDLYLNYKGEESNISPSGMKIPASNYEFLTTSTVDTWPTAITNVAKIIYGLSKQDNDSLTFNNVDSISTVTQPAYGLEIMNKSADSEKDLVGTDGPHIVFNHPTIKSRFVDWKSLLDNLKNVVIGNKNIVVGRQMGKHDEDIVKNYVSQNGYNNSVIVAPSDIVNALIEKHGTNYKDALGIKIHDDSYLITAPSRCGWTKWDVIRGNNYYEGNSYGKNYTPSSIGWFEINKSIPNQQVVLPGKNKYDINKNTFSIELTITSPVTTQPFKVIALNKDDFSATSSNMTIEQAMEKMATEGFDIVVSHYQPYDSNHAYYDNSKLWFIVVAGQKKDDSIVPYFLKLIPIDTLEMFNAKMTDTYDLSSFNNDNVKREKIINDYRPYDFVDDSVRAPSKNAIATEHPEKKVFITKPGVLGTFELDTKAEGNLIRNITNVDFKFEYNENSIKNAHISSGYEAIKKFVPDAYTFKQNSYNLLTLSSDIKIDSFSAPDFTNASEVFNFKNNISKYVQVDGQAPIPTLSSLIQINGYYPEVNKESVFKVSLELPGDTPEARAAEYENYRFGWLLMPVEKWASLQAQVTSTQQYISDIVVPAFSNTLSGVGYAHSFATFVTQTSNPSILICFAIHKDKEPKSITNLDDVMQVQMNINPVKTYGEVFTPDEAINDFSKVDKSIVWKNQMFLYGGSNSFFISDVNNFGYFPMVYNTQIPSDSPIKSMTIYYDSLIVATDRQQFVITGNSPEDKTNPFVINELNDDIGVVADKSVKNNANYIFQLTADGVYLVKSLFNFRDRYNTEKVDDAVAGDIISDPNACAVVWNNKYYLNIPSKKQIWIYYNDFKAWVKYESSLFDLNNMFVINDELWFISNKVGQMYKFSDVVENVHGEGPYKDVDFFSNEYQIVSTYKSKEIDFGLPNHDKKLKKLQVRFAETPGSNQLFVNVWIDGTLKVSPDKDVITTNADGTVTKTTTTTPEITTTANSNWVGTAAGEFKSGDVTYTGNRNNVGNKHDQDTDQLHEVIVAGRGRNMQFEIVHRQNKRLNVKNFATLLKVKKPKALRTYSQKG